MKRGLLIAIPVTLLVVIWLSNHFYFGERVDAFFHQPPEGKSYQNEIDKQKHLYITKSQVIFLGDSHIEQCEWQEVFQDFDISNRGIGGEGISSLEARLDIAVQPDSQMVFIQIGINDLLSGVNPDVVFSRYQMLIGALKSKHCRIIATLPFYTRYFPETNEEVFRLNEKLKEWLPTQSVTLLDINPQLSENKRLKREMSLDGIHLNAKGYQIWIDAIRPVLQ